MSDSPSHYGDYQRRIYAAGLKGQRPELPLHIEVLEARAKETLPPEAYWYVAGGSGEATAQANRRAFDDYRLIPRMLTDVSRRDLSVELFGRRLPHPLLLAPIGVQGIVHPQAELAVARGAAELGVPMVLSSVSSFNLEAVAAEQGDNPRWFQLYWPSDDALAESFVRRAETAGYEAIVVTLDTKMMAWREWDLQHAYLPFIQGLGLANYLSDPVFRAALTLPPEEDMRGAIRHWSRIFAAPGRTWADLARLKAATRLPILLKGVLTAEDAHLALEAGVDGIICSNHGGRQVDGAIAALDALPAVVDAVAGQVPVLFDSGIRRGADVLKAMALGATAVLVGRPYVWGLACGGAAGVAEVLRRLLADTDITLALTGYDRLGALGRKSLQLRR
jgi:lactate 2-monooxygenase